MPKQDKRRERIDTGGNAHPLTDNPFARLGSIQESPPGAPPPEKPTAERSKPEEKPGFRVEHTRKGGYPVFLEKRPGGKNVTVIRNISGDVEGLLRILRKRLGAGGVAREDAIEIQGDHREKVIEVLRQGL